MAKDSKQKNRSWKTPISLSTWFVSKSNNLGKYYLEHYVGKYEHVYVPLILICEILCL